MSSLQQSQESEVRQVDARRWVFQNDDVAHKEEEQASSHVRPLASLHGICILHTQQRSSVGRARASLSHERGMLDLE